MSSPANFDESRFRKQVNAALDKVRTILENTRAPNFPDEVPHQYNDKYLLADGLTNNAMAAQLTCLQLMGLTVKGMQQLKKWSHSRTVTLRLTATETCAFDRKVERQVEDATKHVTEHSGVFNYKSTSKSYHKVVEYFWKFDNVYELFIYEGNNPNERVLLSTRSGQFEIVTGSEHTPKSKSSSISPIDVDISWLLQHISDQMILNFSIDRNSKSCHTPRRNSDIESARAYFQRFYSWAGSVRDYFTSRLFPVETGHGYDLNKMTDSGIFIPVVPLFEERKAELVVKAIEANKGEEKTLVSVGNQSGAMLTMNDCNNFLLEHKRSLEERLAELAKMYPAPPAKGKGKLISSQEANIVVSLLHLRGVSQHFLDGIDYIEHMLRTQLIAAIGKEVQPSDFTNYMRYHNRQLFKAEFEPSLFCYAVRRPDHYPEGTLSIEATLADGSIPESILTSACKADVVRPMYFSINAATDISFTGERYLHAWVSHQFSGDSGPQLKLNARARQFSCFMVLLGTVADETQFLPSHAMIIQNKDDLKIPLTMDQIPTAKEFKDSLQSLSPEQQRFARAYRSMQLAQTIFAICIIQIKPQLEKLLKLENDSLTKEIKLTQDLLELFIKYQIPSDLISYAGAADAHPTKKIEAVKHHVAALQEMLEESRKREIAQVKQERKYAGRRRNPPPQRDGDSSIMPLPQHTRHFVRKGHAEVQPPSLSAGDPIAEPVKGLIYEPDYTQIPAELDRRFEKLDEDSALKPTILKIGTLWEKTSQEALLADPKTESVNVEAQEDERDKAYDLLDALSRSGCLAIDDASLHVILCATHCFDKTLMDTVIQNNVNPIEKVERSVLIVAATIQNRSPQDLLREDQIERVKTYSPMLFGEHAQPLRAALPPALEAPKKEKELKVKDKGKQPVKVLKPDGK